MALSHFCTVSDPLLFQVCSPFEKVLALCLVCGRRQDTQLSGLLFCCVGVLLVPKNDQMLPFFFLSWFGFIDFDSQESESSMMFNMFVNMFWIAEGFGYMGVPFKLLCVNHFCLIFNLESQKTNLSGQKQKSFCLKVHLLLKILKIFSFWHYHCNVVAYVINLIFRRL